MTRRSVDTPTRRSSRPQERCNARIVPWRALANAAATARQAHTSRLNHVERYVFRMLRSQTTAIQRAHARMSSYLTRWVGRCVLQYGESEQTLKYRLNAVRFFSQQTWRGWSPVSRNPVDVSEQGAKLGARKNNLFQRSMAGAARSVHTGLMVRSWELGWMNMNVSRART